MLGRWPCDFLTTDSVFFCYVLNAHATMDENDAFFTRTVVGTPLSVILGRRRLKAPSRSSGLEVRLDGPGERLSRTWRDWLVLSHADDPPGQPRLRPSSMRRWMERHALSVALAGLLLAAVGTVMMGLSLWK